MLAYFPYIIAGLVIWGIFALIRHSRRLMAEQKQMLMELGFSETTTPDSDLTAKVNRLRNIGRGNVRILRCYSRRQAYYTLYFLHVWTGGRSENSTQWTAAIVSKEIDLPTFAISPSLPIKGKLGSWLNSAVTWAVERRGLKAAPIPKESGCAESHYFFAENPTLAAQYFTLPFWERLADDKNRLMMEGTEDLLLFWSMPGQERESRRINWVGKREAVRLRMDIADRIFGWLRECGKQAQSTGARDLSSLLSGVSAIQAERER
ncbi:MAG: hypothetical protein IPH75_07930 [bacterium]|nr:hypothetical protein [bacterium]